MILDVKSYKLVPKIYLPSLCLTAFILVAFFVDCSLELASERYIFLARAIGERGEFMLDFVMTQPQGDMALYKGHYYCAAWPGMGIIMSPVAYLVNLAGIAPARTRDLATMVFSVIAINGTISAIMVFLWFSILTKLGMDRVRSIILTFSGMFGTHYFFYSARVGEHPFGFFLVSVIIYSIVIHKKRRFRDDVLVGLCMGALYLFNQFGMGASFWFIVINSTARTFFKRIFPVLLGVIPGLAMTMFYQKICFGGPFESGYAHLLLGGFTLSDVYAAFDTKFELVAAMIKEAPSILWGVTFSSTRGNFLLCPILLIGPLGLLLKRDQKLSRLALAASFSVLALYGVMFLLIGNIWTGAPGGWGTRYLLCSVPFFILLAGEWAKDISFKILVPTALVSCLISWIGVQYSYSEGLLHHIELFFIGGPTSGPIRFLWLHWKDIDEVTSRLTQVDPNLSGYYWALTHPSAFSFYAVLILLVSVINIVPMVERRKNH